MPVPVTEEAKSNVVEIFSSCQGEGPLLGCRQVFLRFSGCNLDCRYCDTDYQVAATCRVEKMPGSGEFTSHDNPLMLSVITEIFDRWFSAYPNLHHSLSITGGEPLCHESTLNAWLPSLFKRIPLYLETNGTLPEQLGQVIQFLSWVSVDIKLPSLSGQGELWHQHQEFLQVCRKGSVETFVKVVCDTTTPLEELIMAARLVAEELPRAPLILQPVTRSSSQIELSRFFDFQQRLSSLHGDVRIIPQVHALIGMR